MESGAFSTKRTSKSGANADIAELETCVPNILPRWCQRRSGCWKSVARGYEGGRVFERPLVARLSPPDTPTLLVIAGVNREALAYACLQCFEFVLET